MVFRTALSALQTRILISHSKCVFITKITFIKAKFMMINFILQARKKARKLAKISQRPGNRAAKKGEADRKILNMKPKHLFTGKRSIGKNTRR